MTDDTEMVERLADIYPQPQHGWTCFHCGETFKKYGAARDHFGERPYNIAACIIKAGEERGLVMALRKAEARIRELEIAQAKSMLEAYEQALEAAKKDWRYKGGTTVNCAWQAAIEFIEDFVERRGKEKNK